MSDLTGYRDIGMYSYADETIGVTPATMLLVVKYSRHRSLNLPLLSLMNEIITCLPRILSQKFLHLLETQLTQVLNILYLGHNSLVILRRDSWQRAKHLRSSIIHPCTCLGVVVCPKGDGLDDIRLRIVRLQVVENIRGGVR